MTQSNENGCLVFIAIVILVCIHFCTLSSIEDKIDHLQETIEQTETNP